MKMDVLYYKTHNLVKSIHLNCNKLTEYTESQQCNSVVILKVYEKLRSSEGYRRLNEERCIVHIFKCSSGS